MDAVTKISRIIVRDIPALLVSVTRRGSRDNVIPHKEVFAQYLAETVPGKRVLLVHGETHRDAYGATYVLGLYTGFAAVGLYDAERNAFEIGASFVTGEFPYHSLITRGEIRTVHTKAAS